MLPIRVRLFFITAVLCLFSAFGAPAAGEEDQGRLKALYLYNFLLFVDWPDHPFTHREILRIAVIGDDTLYEFIRLLSGKAIQGRELMVERFEAIEDLPPACHVIFIGEAKKGLAPGIIQRVKGAPVLTLSDIPGFTDMGGMVYFKQLACPEGPTECPKRFDVLLGAVKDAGLNIRSRLLRLSDIVK